MKRILLIGLLLVCLIALIPLSACQGVTKIGDIQANPVQFEGKQVKINGTVGETFWLAILNKGAFQVGDGSGTIWVVTTQPPHLAGLEATVKGNVSTGFKLGERTLGTTITETQRN